MYRLPTRRRRHVAAAGPAFFLKIAVTSEVQQHLGVGVSTLPAPQAALVPSYGAHIEIAARHAGATALPRAVRPLSTWPVQSQRTRSSELTSAAVALGGGL